MGVQSQQIGSHCATGDIRTKKKKKEVTCKPKLTWMQVPREVKMTVKCISKAKPQKPVGWNNKAVLLSAEDAHLKPFMYTFLPNLVPVLGKPCNRYNCCGRVWELPKEVNWKRLD